MKLAMVSRPLAEADLRLARQMGMSTTDKQVIPPPTWNETSPASGPSGASLRMKNASTLGSNASMPPKRSPGLKSLVMAGKVVTSAKLVR